MAVNATLTTTTFNTQPAKYLQAGVIAMAGTFNSGSGSMGTTGDTLWLCKLPHKATILDYVEDHSTGATTAIYKSGLATGCNAGGAATLSLLVAAGATATVNRANVVGTLPYQVSISDSDPNGFAILAMTCKTGSSATSSLIVNWRILYTMDKIF